MLKGDIVKVLGVAATVLGLGASLVSGWCDEKKMKAEVADQVANALKNVKKD